MDSKKATPKTASTMQVPDAATQYSNKVSYRGIRIACKDAQSNNDGTYTLMFPALQIPKDVEDIIHDLFPHTESNVYRLLDTEILIASIRRDD